MLQVYCRTIDYIFHSRDLSVQQLLSVPADLTAAYPQHLPCAQYGSDHLAIGARLLLP